MLKHASQTTGAHPIETSLRNVISPFALTLVKGQMSQCIQYTIHESLTKIDVTGDEICFVKLATGFTVGDSITQVENIVRPLFVGKLFQLHRPHQNICAASVVIIGMTFSCIYHRLVNWL